MILHVLHRTRYLYPSPVIESHNEVRLMPADDEEQRCLQFRLDVQPPARARSYRTPFGVVHFFAVRAPHEELDIRAESWVQTRDVDPFAGLNVVENDWVYYGDPAVRNDYVEYLSPTRLVQDHPEAAAIARRARERAAPSAAAFLVSLTRMLNRILSYEPGATHAGTRLEEFLRDRRGVCQDFSHLMLAVCRSQGVPARYVSGYVLAGEGADSMRAEQATHAWVECLLPDGRWHGFDPTNGVLVCGQHVSVHRGRDASDVAPVRGIYRGPNANDLLIEVSVRAEDPPGPLTAPETGNPHGRPSPPLARPGDGSEQ